MVGYGGEGESRGFLIPVEGGEPVPIPPGGLTVGRVADCGLVLHHTSISRRHARLVPAGSCFLLEDLGSKNGLLVNGIKVGAPVSLRAGDVILFGDMAFRYECSGSQMSETAHYSLTDALRRAGRLGMLLELSKLINSSLILSDVLELVMDSAMKVTGAARGLLLTTKEDGSLMFGVSRHIPPEALVQGGQISMSAVERAYRSGKSFVSVDVDSDASLAIQASVIQLGLKSVMCVPLRYRGRVKGVLYVDSLHAARGFTDEDLEILESLADHAAIAMENAELAQENREMFLHTIEALAQAIEKRDPYTGGHTRRVLELSLAIGREMGLGPEEQENVRLAALLHDIGKIGVDDAVLRKAAPLTDEDFLQIRAHPEIGGQILGPVRKLRGAVPGVVMHHEKIDGTGYPLGLKGEQIPLVARIVAVADAYDAMVTDRPYRRGMAPEVALAELRRFAGTQFDAHVVEAFERQCMNTHGA